MNTKLLDQEAEMLDELFCIHTDQAGDLTRLHVILDQHTPDMNHAPEFLLSPENDAGPEIYFQSLSSILL